MIVRTTAIGVLRTGVGTRFEEEGDHPCYTRACRSHERCPAFIVAQLDIDTSLDEDGQGTIGAILHGIVESLPVVGCVKCITVMKEEMKDVDMIVHDSEVEGTPSGTWLTERDVGTRFEQESRVLGFLACPYGEHKDRHALRIDRVGIATGCEVVTQRLRVS